MKIYIRGGAWSNVEDQVLLAAYMKYGGNQWMRIASLLPKKSAAQVKARWEEYLDPTIRKCAWTPKEDSKLLKLAQLMPMQWRTIAQYFGRSAHQCLERYRELIDKASGTPHVADNDAAAAHQMMPNFETWAAVPDPVDMDQESKEMLAEARARLANTQGKKARRKARERQLDVLRKVTAMKKKRELEAAGLVIEKKNMWEDEEKELDPIVTHAPKKGRYDTAEDDEQLKKERIRKIKQRLAEKRKKRRDELNEMQEELKREEAKVETPSVTVFGPLRIPEPQILEEEMKTIDWLRRVKGEGLGGAHKLSLMRFVGKKETWEPKKPVFKEFETQAVQRELPRPFPVSSTPLIEEFEDEVEALVMEECIALALRDARENPPNAKLPRSLLMPPNFELEEKLSNFVDVDEDLLAKAAQLIDAEKGSGMDFTGFVEAWEEQHRDIFSPNLDRDIEKRRKRVERMRQILDERTKAARSTIDSLVASVNDVEQENYRLRRDLGLYRQLQQQEEKMLQARIEVQLERIAELEKEQRLLTKEYTSL